MLKYPPDGNSIKSEILTTDDPKHIRELRRCLKKHHNSQFTDKSSGLYKRNTHSFATVDGYSNTQKTGFNTLA